MHDTLKQLQLTWNLNRVFNAQKKGPGWIIGQTKHEVFVTEWELAYHEVMAISKNYGKISRSVLVNTDANPLHKELRNRNFWEYQEAVNKVFLFIKERSNPWVSAKKATKKIGEAQKKIDIARSRGNSTREILHYDHVEYPSFDEGSLIKHKKHELLVPLEQLFHTPEYQFDKTVTAEISVIVDFMSLIRKIGFEKHPKVRDTFDAAWELFLLRVMLIGSRLFTIAIAKFQSKNRLE